MDNSQHTPRPSPGRFSVDIFQNQPPSWRWSGVVRLHPEDGGPGEEIHRRAGYVSEAAAADGCDTAIASATGSSHE